MHAVELAQLASTFVRYSADLLALGMVPSRDAQHAYWLSARYRHDQWSAKLAAHRQAIQNEGATYRCQKWKQIVPVMQEVLLTEPLARCVAYHAQLLNQNDLCFEFASLSHSVLMAHIEARHRCLHLIVFGQGISVEQSVQLNSLRRAMETYNDQLLGNLHPIKTRDVFCFDSISVAEAQANRAAGVHVVDPTRLHTNALREGLQRTIGLESLTPSPNFRINSRLYSAVLELFPSSFFDSFGLPKSQRTGVVGATSSESSGKMTDLSHPLPQPLSTLFSTNRPKLSPAETQPKRW